MVMSKQAQLTAIHGTERSKVKLPKSIAGRGATVNLKGAKGDSNTFTSYKSHFSTQVVLPVVPCNTPYHYILKLGCWRSTTFLSVHGALLVWNETCSVDTARWALDRSLWHFMMGRVVWGDSQGTVQMLITKYYIVVDLELTWQYPLNEFRSEQPRHHCVNRFHLSLWVSMAACMITSFTWY